MVSDMLLWLWNIKSDAQINNNDIFGIHFVVVVASAVFIKSC